MLSLHFQTPTQRGTRPGLPVLTHTALILKQSSGTFNSALGKFFQFQQGLEKNLTHASGVNVIRALAAKISFTLKMLRDKNIK